MTIERTVRLGFTSASREAGTHTNLSAVRTDGPCLWVAGDETATLERLVADDPAEPSEYAGQTTFRLADLVDLPGEDADEEADLEGLARSGDQLWAVGSHSRRRKRIRDADDDRKGLERLARVTGQDNRQVLLRLPVVPGADGLPAVVRDAGGSGGRAAILGGRKGKSLLDLLDDDEHLGPFLTIPGKDNGLDIEGIAVAGDRVYLGLRGPVLRGWAFVLELRPYADDDDPARLRLADLGGAPYRKHVLDLDGLGVRDLCPHGQDLLVLAGPTMDLDGPVRVYRWHGGATEAAAPGVVRGGGISRELELTFGEGDDHAEGIGLIGPPGEPRLLVVYDSPAAARRTADGTVLADVVRLP